MGRTIAYLGRDLDRGDSARGDHEPATLTHLRTGLTRPQQLADDVAPVPAKLSGAPIRRTVPFELNQARNGA